MYVLVVAKEKLNKSGQLHKINETSNGMTPSPLLQHCFQHQSLVRNTYKAVVALVHTYNKILTSFNYQL